MSEIESLAALARLDDPAFFADDPHAVFKRLRREAPVFWIEPTGFWAVTTYEAVNTVVTDPERFSSRGEQQLVSWTQGREHFMRFSEDAEVPPPTARNLITSDPPFHTVFRKMVLRTGQFGVKAVPGIEACLSPFVDDLLELVCDLAVAGVESTRNMVTSGLVAFAQHPEEWARIQSGEASVDNAVEEILRTVSAAPTQGRVATEDTTLAGQPINAGDRLLLVFASANRDESIWTDPDRFDVTRSPKDSHLAFGRGAHLCIGASLSRLTMRVILDTLLRNDIRFELTAPAKREPGFNATAQYASAPMSFERDKSSQHD